MNNRNGTNLVPQSEHELYFSNGNNEDETKKETESCCSSTSYFQRLITFFNGVFLVSGLTLGALSIWTYFAHGPFLYILPNLTYKIVVYLTLATAALITVASFFGLLTSKLLWKSCTLFYLILVTLAWMCELIIGMLSYTYIQEVRADLSVNLVTPFQEAYFIDKKFSEQVDFIQERLSCCGANSPEDWNSSQWRLKAWSENIEAVPKSCCKTPSSIHCGLRIHPSSISFTGCVHPISQHIEHRLSIFASVSLGFSILQVVGIPFIICFLCGLCQNDFIRQRRIHRQNLENSRFTRNQQRFNLLNSTSEVNGYTFEVNGYDACNDSITFEKQQLCSKI